MYGCCAPPAPQLAFLDAAQGGHVRLPLLRVLLHFGLELWVGQAVEQVIQVQVERRLKLGCPELPEYAILRQRAWDAWFPAQKYTW